MFDADRPIQKSEEDRLGRALFGKYLARCILDHSSTESLTIGLYGGWGVGKTSIINLTLEELRFAASNMLDNEKPVLLNFSPWSYSDQNANQNNLVYSFFRRLSSEMQANDYFKDLEESHIIYLMELYVSFFTHKTIPKSLRPKHHGFLDWLKSKRSKEEIIGWESGRDLTLVKKELNELLSNQKHKLIIFIDNISRLRYEEVIKIFQIVKSMGDFSNTIYILSLDKDYVINSINAVYGEGGADYLEKIIQLPFHVPPVTKQDLEAILLDRLKKVIDIVPIDAWDTQYWADIYYSSIKYFFEDSRDVTRYINTLSFGYVHVKDVVNPVDFFAITVVEVFEPDVYYGIRDNKDLFIDLAENVYPFDEEKLNEDKMRCDEILSRAKKIPEEMILLLLIALFPRLRKLYEEKIPLYHSDVIARKNKRICSYDLFDIYFRLTIPSGDISDGEVKALLMQTSDEEGFALSLLRLNQDDRIPKLLDRLDSVGVYQIKTENIPKVLKALMDTADLFPQGENTPLSFNTPMRLHRIFHQLFKRIKNPEDRFSIFRDAILKSNKSIYIIVHELTEQTRDHIENEDTYVSVEEHDFTKEQLNSLKKYAVDKIQSWAQIGRLVEHPNLIALLYAWRDWGSFEECKEAVSKMGEEDRGLIALLCAAFKDAVSEAIDKEQLNPSWRVYLKNIEDFIPAEKLIPHAEALFKDDYFVKLREKEQLAVLIFLDLVRPNTVKVFPDMSVS